MKVLSWKFIFSLALCAYVFAESILPRVIALYSVTHDVTLTLKNCEDVSCQLKGDWVQDFITLEQQLILPNGDVFSFKISDVKVLSVPPQNNK